jgi:hypothetical protein
VPIRWHSGLCRTLLALALVAAGAVACEEGAGLSNENCDMDTGMSSLGGTLTVQYFASATGDAAMSSLTYSTDLGPRTVDDPTLPYSVMVQLSSARARIRAKGSSGTGTLSIGYGVSDLIGVLEQEQWICP